MTLSIQRSIIDKQQRKNAGDLELNKKLHKFTPLSLVKIIGSVICYILLTVLAIILILFLCGIRPFVVVSGSMEPNISVGSVCFVNQNIPMSEIRQGDIISFSSGNSTVTHRVAEVHKDRLITKGDANNTKDGTEVTADNYNGKIIFWVPQVGYTVNFFRTIPGQITAISVFLILVMIQLIPDKEKSDAPETNEEPEEKHSEPDKTE